MTKACMWAVTALLACPAAAQQPRIPPEIAAKGGVAVGVEDLRRDVIGKTIDAVTANNRPVTIRWNTDNSAQFRGGTSGEGKWRFSESGYCASWNNVRGGAESCFEVFRMPDGSYEVFEVAPAGLMYSGRWQSVR